MLNFNDLCEDGVAAFQFYGICVRFLKKIDCSC